MFQLEPEDWEITEDVMAEIGISHLAHKLCGQMSGGHFQMVLIARALAGRPQIIVLSLLGSLAKDRGLTSTMNTYYPVHALRIATSTLLLHPHQPPKFSATHEVVTAENLQSSFDVEIAISNVAINDRS